MGFVNYGDSVDFIDFLPLDLKKSVDFRFFDLI